MDVLYLFDTPEDWAAWGTWAATAAATAVAFGVLRSSAATARASELREISAQWQDFNMRVMTDPKVLMIVQPEHPGWSKEKVQRLYYHFYILTSLFQAYSAYREGAATEEWVNGLLQLCDRTESDREVFDFALREERGYPDHFAAYVRDGLAAITRGERPVLPKRRPKPLLVRVLASRPASPPIEQL